MIQIIKREYKDLNEAIEDINVISIQYDYFKDYDILQTNKSYTALLKFDVPSEYNPVATLEIATIRKKKSFHVLDFDYRIEFNNEELEKETFSKILECKIYNDKLIEICGHFGFKDFLNIVEMTYIDNGYFKKQYIEVKLKEFELSDGYFTLPSKEKSKFVCENVDYNILYEHIVNVYLQRGYLLDREGLEQFKHVLKIVCELVNERNLKHETLV